MRYIYITPEKGSCLTGFITTRAAIGIILTGLLMAIAVSSLGQQAPVFSTAFFNKFLVNPAFAGIDNQYRVFAFYRTQWDNMPMKPVIAGATAEGSFWKDRIGIGLQASNDRAGIFDETAFSLSYAQKIRLAKNHQLRIGMEGQALMNKINFSAASPREAADPGLAILQPNRTVFDFGAGIAYSFKNTLLLGFSVPNILQPNARYSPEGQVNFQYLRNYTAFAQYRIELLHKKFNITPSLVLRKARAPGVQVDGTVLFDYDNIVFIGGGYRNSFGIIALAGVNILNTVTVAYAFDYTTQPVLSGKVGSTHEIVLGFHLPSNFKAKKKAIELPGTSPDQVSIKQSVLDSLSRNAGLLNAGLASAHHVIDSLVKIANAKAQKLRTDSMAAAQIKMQQRRQASIDSVAQIAKNKAQQKPAVIAEKLSNTVDLSAEKSAGQAFKLDKISFEYKQYRLLPQSAEQLDALVTLLGRYPKTKILVTGYTDNIGSDEYNMALSAKRAEAVATYLIQHGISPGRLRTEGLGSQNPAADNNTESGRDINRRVEFTIER